MKWYPGGSQAKPPKEKILEQEAHETSPHKPQPSGAGPVHASLGASGPIFIKGLRKKPFRNNLLSLVNLQGHLGVCVCVGGLAVGGEKDGLWG